MYQLPLIKGRGAQSNPSNPFDQYLRTQDFFVNEDSEVYGKTKYIKVFAKSILNKVESPDIHLDYSMNPYQGCEHGCVYCYARNSHNYWGYSHGLDFESVIMLKNNAAELLEQKLKSKSWKATPIMLSGNTDCYQPIEKKLEITRSLLKILWKYRHPVGIITKNKLILRDLDILEKMAEHQLVRVAVSINTLNDDLRRKLEPRASTIQGRIKLIKELSNANIPVVAMMAPIIPGLNDHELLPLMKHLSENGADDAQYIILRLNGNLPELFKQWLNVHFPDRTEKILNMVTAVHGGKLNDSRFKIRMKGEGKIAKALADQFRIGVSKYFNHQTSFKYNLALHENYKDSQLKLF